MRLIPFWRNDYKPLWFWMNESSLVSWTLLSYIKLQEETMSCVRRISSRDKVIPPYITKC